MHAPVLAVAAALLASANRPSATLIAWSGFFDVLYFGFDFITGDVWVT